jgi:hypothetical protein
LQNILIKTKYALTKVLDLQKICYGKLLRTELEPQDWLSFFAFHDNGDT